MTDLYFGLVPLLLVSAGAAIYLMVKWRTAQRLLAEMHSLSDRLRQTNEVLQQVFRSAPVGLWASDPDGKVTLWNRAAEKLLGWKRPEALEAGSPGGGAILVDFPRELRTPIPVALRRETREGTALDIAMTVETLRDEAGDVRGAVGVVVDVSEQKQSERTLAASEQRYRELVENATDLIYSIDLQGNFTSINKAAERLSGYTREEVLGMNIANLVAPECLDRARQMIQRTLRGEGSQPYELEIVAKSNRRVTLEVSHRLHLHEGTPTGTHAIARDITERRRAELLERDLVQVLEMIATHQPLETILEQLALTVERQYPDAMCAVMLERDRQLMLAAAPRLPAGYQEAVATVRIGPTSGSCGAAAYWKQSVTVSDILRDPIWKDHREIALDHDLRACWSVPILSGKGEVLGTLATYHRQNAQPDRQQMKLLQTVAGAAAVAIEQRRLSEQLAYQALHDSLTGLPNRTLFEERLRQALAFARRHGHLVALMYLDLDRFKLINDTLGHAAGDVLLRQVAWRLRGCVRETDTLARISGDEFTVIATGLKQPEDATVVAEAILNAFRTPFQIEKRELFVTASIGISIYPQDATEATILQRNADSSMYRAKHSGKNGYQYFVPEIGAAISERLELENQLRRALERSEMSLLYQPQFELSNGRLAGHEALLRWNCQRLGRISPGKFIPVAEESGIIIPIGAWVLQHACRQTRTWQKTGYKIDAVSVNVSALQFAQTDFIRTVEQTLLDSSLDPHFLELELTESMIMRDVEESARKMKELRQMGVRISVDDFGTGYSSLSYLQRLPIDVLKIDQSFVQNFEKTPTASSLVRAIVTLAHGLGMRVTAEGVETEHQFEVVRRMGCDKAQGFLLGRPVPPETAFALPAQSASAQ
ncbi:MAG: EAL domain-containing protein [Acidobacteria bacterium]|nr:EAL domain-containing protein [Acidobacteriota bacterium]